MFHKNQKCPDNGPGADENNSPELNEITITDLPHPLQEAATRAGWTSVMPVQARAIPYMLAGHDIMVQSHTGSGKTGAFALPTIDLVDTSKQACQALVLVPTRELARQVAAEAEKLAGDIGLRTVAVYGGVAYGPQNDAFKKGAHLVVGTPGRVLDHLLKKNLSLDGLKMLVFDEADRMLSMGFYPDMKRVQGFLPKRRLHSCMFSATFPPYVLRLADEFLREPQLLSLSTEHIHVADTLHVYYSVPAMDKDRCLVRLIEMENPASAIIFCNTKSKVHYVATVLERFGYDADELSADLAQNARDKVMARLRAGKLRFLVATDVAARGIDIPDLSHVFQYEPPEDMEAYIHRAGRTGRAGAAGEAVTLVTAFEEMELKRIAKKFKIDLVQRPIPSDADVEAIVSQRAVALLEARLRGLDSVQQERLQRFVSLGRTLGQSEDELPVIAMLLDDYYQQSLHGRPDIPETSAPVEKSRETEKTPRQKSSRRRGGRRPRKS